MLSEILKITGAKGEAGFEAVCQLYELAAKIFRLQLSHDVSPWIAQLHANIKILAFKHYKIVPPSFSTRFATLKNVAAARRKFRSPERDMTPKPET